MNIRLIGLGRVGSNIALNLLDHHHVVIGYDIDAQKRTRMQTTGVLVKDSVATLLERQSKEHLVVFLSIPNQIVDTVIEQIMPHLTKGDTVIDAGNSHYQTTIKRYHLLKSHGIELIDVGIGGGTKGARYGTSLMAGGEPKTVSSIESLLKDLSVDQGYAYVGRPGTGHFVKMVQNGIEYGMMQAIAEGFDLLQASPFELDYEQIANMWNHGSIIESALMGYVAQAFNKDPQLTDIEGKVDDSGEGMWMIEEALKYKVSLPVITQSLYTRYKSKDQQLFGEKIVAAMRKEFGGHAVYKKP